MKKRKRGRPPKENKLDHILKVRISKEDKKSLQKMAKETERKTVSGVVRELIENAPGASRLPNPEDWKNKTKKEKAEWHRKMQE